MFSQSDGTPSSLCSMYAAISLRMHSTPGLALYDPVTETHALALIKRLLQQNTEYGSTVSQLPENCMICNNRGLWMLSNRYTVNWVLYIVLYHGLKPVWTTRPQRNKRTHRDCVLRSPAGYAVLSISHPLGNWGCPSAQGMCREPPPAQMNTHR